MQEKRAKPIIVAILLIIPLISALTPLATINALDNRIQISLGPSTLIADGDTHSCVFVQLTNSKGEPIPAPSDVTVTLTSSRLDVGTVAGSVTIADGSSFGVATFTATTNPGMTLITATAAGYLTGGAELTTTSPSTNSQLKIYPLPSVAPAINGTKGKVVIEILDDFGIPYPSPESVSITLTTSNSSVLKVTNSATIPAGSYYTVVEYTVAEKRGNATISAIAQGFTPSEAEVTTKKPGKEATSLRIEIGPNILLPKDSLKDSAVISIVDKNGAPVWVNGTLAITLSSSSDKTVARVDKSLTMENGTYYAYIDINSVGRGTSVIAASAQGLEMNTQTLSVEGSVPAALIVYTTPESLLSGDSLRPTVTILAIDQNAMPIIVDEDVNVFLSSSNTDVGTVAQFATIKAGQYYTQVPLQPESDVGSISISASAKGFEPSSSTIKTTFLTMNATLTTSRPTSLNETVLVSISVDRFGTPVEGVKMELTALGGTIITKDDASNANGLITATIRQTSSTMKVSVYLTKASYKDVSLTKLVTIPAQQSTELTVNILGFTVPLFYIIVGIGVVVIVIFAVYIFLKYRRRNSDKLEVVG